MNPKGFSTARFKLSCYNLFWAGNRICTHDQTESKGDRFHKWGVNNLVKLFYFIFIYKQFGVVFDAKYLEIRIPFTIVQVEVVTSF